MAMYKSALVYSVQCTALNEKCVMVMCYSRCTSLHWCTVYSAKWEVFCDSVLFKEKGVECSSRQVGKYMQAITFFFIKQTKDFCINIYFSTPSLAIVKFWSIKDQFWVTGLTFPSVVIQHSQLQKQQLQVVTNRHGPPFTANMKNALQNLNKLYKCLSCLFCQDYLFMHVHSEALCLLQSDFLFV